MKSSEIYGPPEEALEPKLTDQHPPFNYLTEILVVVFILLTLAAIIIPTLFPPFVDEDGKQKAKAMCSSIVTSIASFKSTLSVLPVIVPEQGRSDRVYETTADSPLLLYLCGEKSLDERVNPQLRTFLDTGGHGVEGLTDSHGTPFRVYLDNSFDGKVTVPISLPPGKTYSAVAVVVSAGKDKKFGSKDDVGSQNLKSSTD